jgi:hypothetical protein
MYGFAETKHSLVRSQQRSINNTVKELLLIYGDSCRCGGGVDRIYFSKDSLNEILSDLGSPVCKMCEKFKNTYAIVSEDGVLITIARSYRKTVH